MSRRKKDGTWTYTVSPLTPELAFFIADRIAQAKKYSEICAAAKKAGFTLNPPDISRHLDRDTHVTIDGEERSFRDIIAGAARSRMLIKADEIEEIEREARKLINATTGANYLHNSVKLKSLISLARLKVHRIEVEHGRHLRVDANVTGEPRILVVPESGLFSSSE